MTTEKLNRDYDENVKNNFIYKLKGTKATYRIFSEHGILTGAYPMEAWW